MHTPSRSLLVIAHLAVAYGATIVVQVAETGLSFSPSSFSAEVGDQVEFHFARSGHAVTQGDFTNPCQPSSSGFNSGFVSTANGLPFTITVANTDPIYFYCPVTGHCQLGMAGAINAPDDQSAAAYIAAAANTNDSGEPQGVQGGVFASATTQGTVSTSSSGSTSTPAPAKTTTPTNYASVAGGNTSPKQQTSAASGPASSSASAVKSSAHAAGTAVNSGVASSSATGRASSSASKTTSAAGSTTKPEVYTGAASAFHPSRLAVAIVPLLCGLIH